MCDNVWGELIFAAFLTDRFCTCVLSKKIFNSNFTSWLSFKALCHFCGNLTEQTKQATVNAICQHGSLCGLCSGLASVVEFDDKIRTVEFRLAFRPDLFY